MLPDSTKPISRLGSPECCMNISGNSQNIPLLAHVNAWVATDANALTDESVSRSSPDTSGRSVM